MQVAITSTLIISLGLVIALYNLRLLIRSQTMQSASQFLDFLESCKSDRHIIYNEFVFDPNHPEELPQEHREAAERVIDSLNRIAMFIENKLLKPEFVFSLCHTVVIRCWFKLEPYAAYKEQQIGGRYARRVKRLDVRAKSFHDIRPHQRITSIKIQTPQSEKNTPIVIYKTNKLTGVSGFFQRLFWRIQYVFKIY